MSRFEKAIIILGLIGSIIGFIVVTIDTIQKLQ